MSLNIGSLSVNDLLPLRAQTSFFAVGQTEVLAGLLLWDCHSVTRDPTTWQYIRMELT